jgi:hypothetical protein
VKSFSHAAGGISINLPVLRGFSRSVKQDSETSKASGGVSAANVASCGMKLWKSKKLLLAETFFIKNLFLPSGDSFAAAGSVAIHILCVKQK